MLYAVILTRTFQVERTPELIQAHLDHLDRLRQEGKLLLSGPFADFTGGMYLLQNVTEAEAREIVAADPLIRSGYSSAQIRAWDVAFEERLRSEGGA